MCWPAIFGVCSCSAAGSVALSAARVRGATQHAVVADPGVAEALKPYYNQFCKRPCFHDEYLATFNRPNVELVTDDIREFTATGIVTKDGKARPLDCVILGTGFIVDPRIYMKKFELRGLNGHTIQQDWKVSPTAYLGITAAQLDTGAGVGVMVGAGSTSAMDSLPHDETTVDLPGVESYNSSFEWGDADNFTAAFARIGH